MGVGVGVEVEVGLGVKLGVGVGACARVCGCVGGVGGEVVAYVYV